MRVFHQNVQRLPLFQKNIFPFSYVIIIYYYHYYAALDAPCVDHKDDESHVFGCDMSVNKGIIKFLRNLGQFPHLPQNRRMRQLIQLGY